MSFRDFPFSVNKDSFAYLGVCGSQKYRDLFDSNFKMVFNKAKQDMERWSALPLSLAGRINSVKLTIMPRFLFLFQAIPVFIPKSFFKDLNKLISTFIWNKNVPRIWKEDLERQKEDGGLFPATLLPKFCIISGRPTSTNLNSGSPMHTLQYGVE